MFPWRTHRSTSCRTGWPLQGNHLVTSLENKTLNSGGRVCVGNKILSFSSPETASNVSRTLADKPLHLDWVLLRWIKCNCGLQTCFPTAVTHWGYRAPFSFSLRHGLPASPFVSPLWDSHSWQCPFVNMHEDSVWTGCPSRSVGQHGTKKSPEDRAREMGEGRRSGGKFHVY